MRTLYVIPARGGSKGIPHKNIRPLGGIPLIGYSVRVARELADDRDICVSTDDPEIAATIENMGLKVPFLRPAELATDKSGTYEVLLHALDFYASQGIDYDVIVLLQPTSPFRRADDVRRAMALYTPDIDMVVTVKEAASKSPSRRGTTRPWSGSCPAEWRILPMRRPRCPAPGGQFRRRVMCEMDARRSVDLDTEIDWLVAEKLIENGILDE